MKLEEAIKQSKPFKCPYEKALVNLLYTQSWLDGELKKYFNSIGVTGKQYNILRILNGADKPVSTAFIRERLLDRLSDVSRVVERMVKNQLVVRKTCQTDKRLVDLSLSAKGRKILKDAEEKKEVMHNILSNLSPKEATALNNLLDKVRSKNIVT